MHQFLLVLLATMVAALHGASCSLVGLTPAGDPCFRPTERPSPTPPPTRPPTPHPTDQPTTPRPTARPTTKAPTPAPTLSNAGVCQKSLECQCWQEVRDDTCKALQSITSKTIAAQADKVASCDVDITGTSRPAHGMFLLHALFCATNSVAFANGNGAEIAKDTVESIGKKASVLFKRDLSPESSALVSLAMRRAQEVLTSYSPVSGQNITLVPTFSSNFYFDLYSDEVDREMIAKLGDDIMRSGQATTENIAKGFADEWRNRKGVLQESLDGAKLKESENLAKVGSASNQMSQSLNKVKGLWNMLQENVVKYAEDVQKFKKISAQLAFYRTLFSVVTTALEFSFSMVTKLPAAYGQFKNLLGKSDKAAKSIDVMVSTIGGKILNGTNIKKSFQESKDLINATKSSIANASEAFSELKGTADEIKEYYEGMATKWEAYSDAKENVKKTSQIDGVEDGSKHMRTIEELLNELIETSISISQAAFDAARWADDDNLSVAGTELASNLLVSTVIWSTTRARIMNSLYDAAVCPENGAANPWREKRRALGQLAIGQSSLLHNDLLALRQAAPARSLSMKRSLNLKEMEAEQKKICAEGWDKLDKTCTDFTRELGLFTAYGEDSHRGLFGLVESIRGSILIRKELKAADQAEDTWKAVAENGSAAVLQREQGMRSVETARQFIQELCRSMFYKDLKPPMDLQVDGNFAAAAKVDAKSCTVTLGLRKNIDLSGLSDVKWNEKLMIDQLDVLKTLYESVKNNWSLKQAFDDYREDARLTEFASCKITSQSFIDELFAGDNGKPSGSALFEIRLPSFRDANKCLMNAELVRMTIAFSDSDNNILPRPQTVADPGAVQLKVQSLPSSLYYKYSTNQDASAWTEFAFQSPPRQTYNIKYEVRDPEHKCEDENGRDLMLNRTLCSNKAPEKQDKFMRMPLFGKYNVSWAGDLPRGLSKPKRVHIKVTYVTKKANQENCNFFIDELAAEQMTFAPGREFLNRVETLDELLVGPAVCGGSDSLRSKGTQQDFPDDDAAATPDPDDASLVPFIAIGAAAASLLMAAAYYKRVTRAAAPSALAASKQEYPEAPAYYKQGPRPAASSKVPVRVSLPDF